jgi:hypothetical protein
MKYARFAVVLAWAACGTRSAQIGYTPEPPAADADDASPEAGMPTPDAGTPTLGDGSAPPPNVAPDPVTCDDAVKIVSYMGCEYWPTVTANWVDPVFDYALAVANVGATAANLVVTGPNGVNVTRTVNAGALETIYLPWVPELKGGTEFDKPFSASTIVKNGAYHLVADRPVVVYQFNALEYTSVGGPPGKDWGACDGGKCNSFTNDASLLLPTTALTGTYRIVGSNGWTRQTPYVGTNVTITATHDGTTVTMSLPPAATVVGGNGVPAMPGGASLTLTLDAGDVAELTTPQGTAFDFSGGLLKADHPVQVITGMPCTFKPESTTACDHLEESVFPAETLGTHYVVATPTGPAKNRVGQLVRFVGNADQTALTFHPNRPAGCPGVLNAGEVIECLVTIDFEVVSDKGFAVATFQLGGEAVDPNYNGTSKPLGDPSQSFAVAVEQFRKRYVFLAPDDYLRSFVDVVAGPNAKLTLDGNDVSAQLAPIPGTAQQVARLTLAKGAVHTLEGNVGIGIQVIGYGENTSYQYPGGLNLTHITEPPPK